MLVMKKYNVSIKATERKIKRLFSIKYPKLLLNQPNLNVSLHKKHSAEHDTRIAFKRHE